MSNDLRTFALELHRLDRTFGVFSELATGTCEGFQVRSISSTDLTVFVDAAPEIAACTAIAVERVVALYKKLLEIRKLRQGLADHGVTEKDLAGIESHAETYMKKGLKPVVKELIDDYWKGNDKPRENELKKNLESSLNEIANRLDRGFHIEVRVEPLVEGQEDEEQEDAAGDPARDHIATILRAQPGLQFFRVEGDPILQLPEATGKGEAEDLEPDA